MDSLPTEFEELRRTIEDGAFKRQYPALLNAKQAATVMGVGHATIRRACRAGQLNAVDSNPNGAYRLRRITPDALARWWLTRSAIHSGVKV